MNSNTPNWEGLCTLSLRNKFFFEAETAENVVKTLSSKYQHVDPVKFEEVSRKIIMVSSPLFNTFRLYCADRMIEPEVAFTYENTLRFFRYMQFTREAVLGERR